MARPKRTDVELVAASGHLIYEIAMLRATAHQLATLDPGHEIAMLALIESFLVHARALLHCFYPSGQIHDDDVLAADFFDPPDRWEAHRPALSAELVDIRSQVNTHLAHLSYRRQAGRVSWKYAAITAALDDVAKAFAKAAPRTRLDSRWP